MITRYFFASVKGQSSIGNIQFLKRFYERATIQVNKQQAHPQHKYIIQLDGKTIKTPNRHTLAVPTERLALMLVYEFEKQQEYLKPALMPFLALCRTAVDLDLTPNLRQHILESIYTFLPTDTMLFCGDENSSYQERYNKQILPLLKVFGKEYAMELEPTYTLQPPKVSETSVKFHRMLALSDNWKLLGLQTVTVWLKSTIAATLIVHNLAARDEIVRAARLEEQYQADRFGWVQEKIMEENNVRMMVDVAYLLSSLSKS